MKRNKICPNCFQRMKPGKRTRDHLIPQSKGGALDWSNIWIICEPCNNRKADNMPTDEMKIRFERYKANAS